MTHTFYQNYYHLIWSTKERRALLLAEYKDRIFKYLGGSLKTLGCTSFQEKHHKKQTFRDEFIKLLNRHKIEYDEKYLWR